MTKNTGTITREGDRVAILGDVNPDNRKRLLELATQAINGIPGGSEDRRCVIDLHGAGYIDASGIATLIRIARDAKERGVELVITNATVEFRQLVENTDALHGVFTFREPSPEEVSRA